MLKYGNKDLIKLLIIMLQSNLNIMYNEVVKFIEPIFPKTSL